MTQSHFGSAGWDQSSFCVEIHFKNMMNGDGVGDTVAFLSPSRARILRDELTAIVEALNTLGLIDDEE